MNENVILSLHLGLSYSCNLNCKHCFVNKNKTLITYNKVISIIDELEKYGLMFVTFTYGEPLLSPIYFHVSEYLKRKGIVRILMSNGTLINKENYKKVYNSAEKIFISIDSSCAKEHDLNRGGIGTFSKAINSIQLLRSVGNKVSIATTVTNTNSSDLGKIYQLAQTLNVDKISFLRERRNGKIERLSDSTEYVKLVTKRSDGNANPRIIIHDYTTNDLIENLYKNNKITSDRYCEIIDGNRCMCKHTISVEPNGNVKRCNISGNVLGNIFDKEINRIMEEKYENFSCIPTISWKNE